MTNKEKIEKLEEEHAELMMRKWALEDKIRKIMDQQEKIEEEIDALKENDK